MAAMEEIEALLLSLQALKPPGVTPSKINAITAKCVDNVQCDSAIVQKIQQQFKNSPVTHKLGVLYVVDSITRQWKERARLAGQAVSKNAAPGTFASGVQKVTDVLPTLMTDLIQLAPQNQKEKISKLLDIWERAQTFPQNMLASFKQLLNKPQNTNPLPGNQPNGHVASNGIAGHANAQQVAPVAALQDTGSLLAALAIRQQNGQTNHMPTAPPAVPYQNPPPPQPGFVLPPTVATNGQPSLPPFPPVGGDLMNQLLPLIANGTIPPDQVMHVLALLAQAQAQNGNNPLVPPVSQNVPQPGRYDQNGSQADGYEQNGSRYRDRSRSPDENRRRRSPNRRSPPNRRDSPTYGVYDPNAAVEANMQNRYERGERGRGRAGKQRGGRNDRNEYRQRTPPAQRRQPSPPGNGIRNGQPKLLQWDKSMPPDHIKVLSRTLFVGGAGGSEDEIRNIFSQFGDVQTCIVNQEKRHAFVKMVNREYAVAAKEGMDNTQDPNAKAKARQTRWGVGFGPRDCSDYQTGISVIPISRLTDADRKWVLTAEYGGTGGRPIEGGMVMEEPDIEIGAGVSSKAISRRVPPDVGHRGGKGGQSQNHAPRGGSDNAPHARFRQGNRPQETRHMSPRPDQVLGVPPAIPGFGFQL
ncbi:hypothetical protein K504DRAFT_376636 [Pleomassaria siparia CBS 279.74]|uniref:Uncharacterized protein n=1 Tax=Pleomassaria siparia CBS 279.74 TaxID=1314801 RepID=A0A6G1KFI3_9PLEO|nr:hypothetical protein K504DRAFT_376636 [Pleomassaria siparia CBS 279.74]